MSVSLTGSDVVTLNGRVFHDFAQGDVIDLEFPAELVKAEPSKNGNIIYALNVGGLMSKLTMRLLLGGPDDQYINSLLASQLQDLSLFILIVGSFVKRVGDGQGNVTNVIYNTLGGVVTKYPKAKTNTAGETEQSVVEWVIDFGQNSRAIM
jgi:hypothetical protein